MVNAAIACMPDYLTFSTIPCIVFGKKSTLLTLKKFTKTGFCGQILGTLSERTAATNDSLGTAARLRMRWRVL